MPVKERQKTIDLFNDTYQPGKYTNPLKQQESQEQEYYQGKVF